MNRIKAYKLSSSRRTRGHLAVRADRRARLVIVPAENDLQIPIFETVLNGIKLAGSIVGTMVDLAAVF